MRQMIQSEDGFTLTEILVAIVIVGILSVMAINQFDLLVTNTKTLEAKNQLRLIYEMQKMHKRMHDSYSSDFQKIGFEMARLKTDGGPANYRFEMVTAEMKTFTARATAVVDFDDDGTYNVWEVTESGEIRQVVAD